ncbi:hypothetical protein [[Clostridium] innocuum]|uniref:hypothetical protein n=1 Tax=Clostridium innocuum TaxID=1522 RepID=UPI00189BC16B|nr:hypothetical protein [[Clostridium] innocuum]
MKQKKHLIILFTALITLSSYAVFYAKDFFQYANEWNLFSVGIRIWDLNEILYLIFDYPHKHYTFKHFEI